MKARNERVATREKARDDKLQQGRLALPAPSKPEHTYPVALTSSALVPFSGMFGTAAEVVGSAASGTGIDGALIGGASGSMLDRMIQNQV
jgi:hypothetical protein